MAKHVAKKCVHSARSAMQIGKTGEDLFGQMIFLVSCNVAKSEVSFFQTPAQFVCFRFMIKVQFQFEHPVLFSLRFESTGVNVASKGLIIS